LRRSSQLEDGTDGGRGTDGFARPYVRAAQGTLVRQRFDRRHRIFEAVIDVDPAIAMPTEIATPLAAYPAYVAVEAPSTCRIETGKDGVRISAFTAGQISIRISPDSQALRRVS
jgi:hypothetical protein